MFEVSQLSVNVSSKQKNLDALKSPASGFGKSATRPGGAEQKTSMKYNQVIGEEKISTSGMFIQALKK